MRGKRQSRRSAVARGYNRSWLARDVIAGVTLAAVAIPEVHGLHLDRADAHRHRACTRSSSRRMLFVLLGSSRLLVVGADSATAALLAAGSAALPSPGDARLAGVARVHAASSP